MRQQRTNQAQTSEAGQRTRAACPEKPRATSFDASHCTLQLQRMIGNRALGRMLQAKLKVNEPGDEYEQEADRVAEQVMRMPDPQLLSNDKCGAGRHGENGSVTVQRKCAACESGKGLCPECEEEQRVQRQPLAANLTPLIQRQGKNLDDEEDGAIQAKEANGHSAQAEPNIASNVNAMRGGGQPLPQTLRNFFEPRFGYDFSNVRVHANGHAAETARAINARAFTVGREVVFGSGEYAPGTKGGQHLLAHELAHVVQQRNNKPEGCVAQRRLIASGAQSDVDTFFSLAEPASGLMLARDPATNHISAIGSLATPPTSPSFQSILTDIMDDPTHHAEVNFGTHQTAPTPGGGPATGVAGGLFPMPPDLTGSRVQLIDMDDILAIEAGAPGNGVAALAHELNENFQAHFAIPTPGVSQFPAAHEAGVAAESSVAVELVGPGERVAEVTFQTGTIIFRSVEDFESYYLVSDLTQDPTTRDVTISNVRRAPKVVVSDHTVDQFVVDSAAIPPSGTAALAAVAANVAANPESTVLIEGFTDNTGSSAHNDDLSLRRAENARIALDALGIEPTRVHVAGRGETGFVAANDTATHRALNRRIEVTVTRPGT